MKPVWWIIAIVAGAAFVAGQQLSRNDVPAAASPPAAKVAAPVAEASVVATQAHPPLEVTPPPTAEQAAQWIADLNNADAAKRSTAINALARAPRAQALPALRNVLLGGEPTVDRPLALNSLRELALDQGDADGRIRQTIREVIYHGDDESLATGAQDALDVVEESEMK